MIAAVGERSTPLQAATASDYTEAIARTMCDPLLILNADLRLQTANEAFYRMFKVSRVESEGRLVYDLGDGQWNIPRLRELLEEILPRNSFFNDYEVARTFPAIGRRTMLLNARKLDSAAGQPARILLGIQDVSELLQYQAQMRRSEIRYRRLFEAAHDGVLILDAVSRKIIDANPFMKDLLGYAREELLGKELWEIGLLQDERASHAAFRELQQKGQFRYENLPLQTKSGKKSEVEVVANRYEEDGQQVIQCNIRDITERKRTEETLRQTYAELQAHAKELDRFNRVAVGRELRMVELKKEVNELCQRQGQAVRYPFEFERDGKDLHA
jgi:PAS domain S-box-containing protein